MSLHLSIGLEVEFLVATLIGDCEQEASMKKDDNRSKIIKLARFDLAPGEEIPLQTSGELTDAIIELRVMRHIGETIEKAGLPINPECLNVGDTTKWEVGYDASIVKESDLAGYRYVGVEVKSPVLNFSDVSMQQVEDLCLLLTRTYHIRNNKSTGLHVHIGCYELGFDMISVKRLIAFLYTFEPQLSSLHPNHRLQNEYCCSMRGQSRFVVSYAKYYGVRPTPAVFVAAIMNCVTKNQAISYAADVEGPKYCQYNFGGLRDADEIIPDQYRKTIEFRQHAGTMDGVAITHWIKVIVGILDFVERGNPVELMNLLLVTHRAEKWEKQGDGHDHIREKKVGPILADEEFTIIHLLHYIGLPEQALYYEDKWYKHEIPRLPQIQHEPRVFWEYETTMKLGSSEYKLAQLSRELWEDLQKSIQTIHHGLLTGMTPLLHTLKLMIGTTSIFGLMERVGIVTLKKFIQINLVI